MRESEVQAKADDQPWHVRARLQPLKDWMTLGEVAYHLGISRQAVHRLVERGTLSARTLGSTVPDTRPIIVVHVKSVQNLPMSPQRRRELDRRVAEAEQETRGGDRAELADELPEG